MAITDSVTGNKPTKMGKGYKNPLMPAQMEMARVMPQAVDLEQAILGAILLQSEALNTVSEILRPESFYRLEHQMIFSAVQDLFGQAQPVDVITVTNQLRKRGELEQVGGAHYLAQLSRRISSASNIEAHSRSLQELYMKRELIKISLEVAQNAQDDSSDIFELLDNTESKIFDLSDKNFKKNTENAAAVIKRTLEEIANKRDSVDGVTGVPSGLDEVDKITSGWQKGDLVVLAARPGMGKTAFILSVARNAAVMHKKSVAVFTLEMPDIQLMTRLISSEAKVRGVDITKGRLPQEVWQRITAAVKNLEEAKLFIDDTSSLRILELRAKCRRLKAQHGLDLIIIDYLQLMSADSGKNGNREQEISIISRSLKSLAKELEVPVIALSQLNRSAETRQSNNKRPQLSDLRESGAIEQDADMVIFLYRAEYYKIEEDEHGPTKNRAEVIIAKHRNGALGEVQVRFDNEFTKFGNLEDEGFGGGYQGSSTSPAPSMNSFPGSGLSSFDNPNSGTVLPSRSNNRPLPDNPIDEVPF